MNPVLKNNIASEASSEGAMSFSSNRMNKGAGNLNGLLILGFILIAISALPSGERHLGFSVPGDSYNQIAPGTSLGSIGNTQIEKREAKEATYISIGSGNASYTYQPYEEYITIENNGQNAVDITDWQLRNGKDERPYYSNGSQLQRFSADIAVIPKAAKLFLPTLNQVFTNVVLEPGEIAIVTSGSIGVRDPYTITSFKENMCTGYIEALPDYAFTPPLNQSCPRPSLEPGVENMDRECRDFLATYPSCQTPKFGGKDRDGYPCKNCINGRTLSSSCVAFMKEHYHYQGCLANHAGKPNFYGRTWRIYLGRGWEMWADKYESIELFNAFGQLVDYQNY